VRQLVEELGGACDIAVDDVARATALLHDVIEDSEIGREEIEARFGPEVARRVQLLTKTGKGPDATAAYHARLREHADDALRLVKVCDRIHNLSELHLAPDVRKLEQYVGETFEHFIPLARACSDPDRGRALVAALHDGIRAACRAQGRPTPEGAALSHRRVPLGVYAVLSPADPHRAPPAAVDAASDEEAEELGRAVAELIAGGVAMIQLRLKARADREMLALLEAVRPACRRSSVPLIVNDRADLCVASDADGVHVGQTDLPPPLVRKVAGEGVLVGASSHTEPELLDLLGEGGADHIAVGPVYLSPTKQGHAPVVGLEALARRCRISSLPVVAIGGITSPARAAECAAAGASLVATVSALAGPGRRPVLRRMSACFFAARARAGHAEGPRA
jgi:thiamine-phosphate pyrophosphorylase